MKLMNEAKSDFSRNMISDNSDNPLQHWKCINRTLHRKASVSLPAMIQLIHSAILYPYPYIIPIPTFLLKSCLHVTIVPISKIVNLSLSSVVFASHFK